MNYKHITMAGLDPVTQPRRVNVANNVFGARTRARWVAALNAAMVKEG